MKITRLRITSYRGIEALDTNLGPAGAIIRGANARGKTSVLKAIRAALAAQDIAPDAIKLGADKAEILVDLDDHSVRRVITAKGSTLTVEKGGMKASKPTTYLADLLGGAAIDPLDLFLAKPKDRKALILAALPVSVTREQLETYTDSFELPIDFDTSGHGLEVLERARKYFYDERTVANKEAAEAERTAERLAADAKAAAQAVTPGAIVPIEEARAALSQAERELMTLETRASEATEAERRTSAQRARVMELRSEAMQVAAGAGSEVDTSSLEEQVASAGQSIHTLEEQLTAARLQFGTLTDQLAAARAETAAYAKAVDRAADLRSQADQMEAALAAAGVAAPPEAELVAAKDNVERARASVDRAAMQAKALLAVEASESAKRAASAATEEATVLDTVVKRLSKDAPAALFSTTQGIPGLAIDGDEVLLDGKRLDALCGAEQMKLAVEIARRANARTKILIVDGLERLDPEQLEAFVSMATEGGFQLIATRVDRGAVVIEALELDSSAAAAE